jgi:quinol monooxygenase YgiN
VLAAHGHDDGPDRGLALRRRRDEIDPKRKGPAVGSGTEKEMDMGKVTVGLWVPLQAKPGKEADVEAFLEAGQALVEEEPGTTAWFAVRLGNGQFGIFDVFPDDDGRQAHLSGKVAAALMEKAPDLFADAPQIHQIDVIAEKL